MVEVVVVLAQGLAVIRRERDDRRVLHRRDPERLEHAAHLRVGGGNLAVVLSHVPGEAILPRDRPPLRDPSLQGAHHRQAGSLCGPGVEMGGVKWRGGRVGGVGIHVVKPEEEGPIRAGLLQELNRGLGRGSRPVHLRLQCGLLPGLPVDAEALAVSERGGHVGVVDDGHGVVARLLQHAGESGVEVEKKRMGLAVARLRRAASGQQRHEAAPGLGPIGEGFLEERALAGESIDVRARRPVVAVGSQVIRPQRVDGDQKDTPPAPGFDRPSGGRTFGLLSLTRTSEKGAGERRERHSTDEASPGGVHGHGSSA